MDFSKEERGERGAFKNLSPKKKAERHQGARWTALKTLQQVRKGGQLEKGIPRG